MDDALTLRAINACPSTVTGAVVRRQTLAILTGRCAYSYM